MNTSDFLAEFRSPNTQKTYRIALAQFFKHQGTTPEEYLATQHDYKHDLIIFARFLESEQFRTPKTIRCYVGAIVTYLDRNGIELPRKFWKELGVANVAMTNDEIPSKDTLRSILQHCDVCGKALFLLGASSGMRIDDILTLRLETVKGQLGKQNPKLTFIQQKTRQKQVAFFTRECAEAIGEWIKIRDAWLSWATQHCQARGIGDKDGDDDRLFPFEYAKALTMWNRAVEASGNVKKDENTGRQVLHIHSLRKYFRTHLTMAGVEPNIAESFLGHIQGLREYHKYDEDYITRQYAMAEAKELRVMVDVVESAETTHTIQVLQEKIRILEDAMRRTLIQDLEAHPESKRVWGDLAH